MYRNLTWNDLHTDPFYPPNQMKWYSYVHSIDKWRLSQITSRKIVETKNNSRSGVGNYSLMDKSSSRPVFVNKVLLEHSHAHLVIYCL